MRPIPESSDPPASRPSARRGVAEIRAVSSPGGRRRLGKCSIEGLRLFERALRAGARIDQAVVGREFLEDDAPRIRALRVALEERGVTLVEIPRAELEELTEGRSLGGLVGTVELPPAQDVASMLARHRRIRSTLPRLVCCVGFNDPGNLGALARTAHGTGAAGLIAIGAAGAFHPKAVRTSMGSLFRLPVLECDEPGPLLDALAEAGVRTAGAVTAGGVTPRALASREEPVALFLGSEAFGLEPKVLALMDETVSIPMVEDVDSFSVNAAAAILLYELQR